MRKVVAILAVLGMAAVPAMAAIVEAIPSGTPTQYWTLNYQTGVLTAGSPGDRSVTIYSDLVQSPYFANNGANPPPSGSGSIDGFADDIHAISGGTITSWTLGYFVSAQSGPPGNYPVRVSLWPLDPMNETAVPVDGPNAGAFFTADLSLPGADGLQHVVTLTGLSIAAPADFWAEQDWAGQGVGRAGPIITANSGGSPGYSHDVFSASSLLYYFGPGVWADFVNEFSIVPEPVTIGLLAAGGLVVLRRRR
jgi:hypothetical protein